VRRSAAALIATALAVTACGGGEVQIDTTIPTEAAESPSTATTATDEASQTTQPAPASSEIILTEAETGSRVQVLVGDTVVVRLPEDDPAADPWILARQPDPLVLGTGDVFVWIPSDPGAEAPYAEFVFFVLGPGDTSVLFSRGEMTPTTPTVEFRIEASSG
jgi:hypothetical protein